MKLRLSPGYNPGGSFDKLYAELRKIDFAEQDDLEAVTEQVTALDEQLTNSQNGWYAIADRFTYSAANTIFVGVNAGERYQIGDYLWMQNDGNKYFNIIAVGSTTITVTGGTSFVLANAEISDVYISRAQNPFGHPQWYSWTPSAYTASGLMTWGTVTPTDSRFCICGRNVLLEGRYLGTTAGVANNKLIINGLPVTPANPTNNSFPLWVLDGAGVERGGFGYVNTTGTLTAAKYDNTNFGLGTFRGVYLGGASYRI